MDLTYTTTPTKIPDTENETPPHTPSTTNGALKKHNHHRQTAAVVTYKECLKNHAASLGGHALDGCGEFMASSTPTDPMSLKCVACGCHRNFHRRDPDEYTTTTTHFLDFHRHVPPPLSSSASPPPQPINYYSAPHMLLALSNGMPEDQHAMNHHQVVVATPRTPTVMKAEKPSGRKRFRTKFTQEQKEKMYSFSEKVGWKLQKCEESIVEEFCNEVGIAKGVLKVWMHNNKNTLGKRDNNNIIITTTAATATTKMNNGGVRFENNWQQ